MGEPLLTSADWFREEARKVARAEVASLCALVLRRSQEWAVSDAVPEGVSPFLLVRDLRAVVGEALRDFGGTPAEPGRDVGVERDSAS